MANPQSSRALPSQRISRYTDKDSTEWCRAEDVLALEQAYEAACVRASRSEIEPSDDAKDASRWRKWCNLNDGCYWDMRRFIHSDYSKWHWIPAWEMVSVIDAAMLLDERDGGS